MKHKRTHTKKHTPKIALRRTRQQTDTQITPKAVRVQKLLAEHGYGSRRAIDALLAQGAIYINNEVAKPGALASTQDTIHIHSNKVLFKKHTQQVTQILLYHKQALEICSRKDEQDRRVVFASLPNYAKKWHMVGRLDYMTTGLLLFTNNGELAHFLMHPRYQHQRVYLVRTLGTLDADCMNRMQQGIVVDGELLSAKSINALDTQAKNTPANKWYRVVMTSGQNRAVRRLFTACGLEVSRLKRTEFHTIILPNRLATGACQLGTQTMVKELQTEMRNYNGMPNDNKLHTKRT